MLIRIDADNGIVRTEYCGSEGGPRLAIQIGDVLYFHQFNDFGNMVPSDFNIMNIPEKVINKTIDRQLEWEKSMEEE